MPVKESSDELNPTVAAADAAVASPRAKQSAKDYFALAIATCGVGYLPLAPGTWGSLVGVGLYVILRRPALSLYAGFGQRQGLILLNPQIGFLAIELVIILILTLLGIWGASRVERLLQVKDPGKVVIDEVAGQMIALLPVPLLGIWPLKIWIIVSFVLFRFFDIVKPYPARQLEGLRGGLGIMADDIVAGAYAAIVLAVTIALFSILMF
ncbi:MAG: phosphatidylglycerophosphatase A [Pyrinomonadaceae bacterium]